jgi:hypothetical protein
MKRRNILVDYLVVLMLIATLGACASTTQRQGTGKPSDESTIMMINKSVCWSSSADWLSSSDCSPVLWHSSCQERWRWPTLWRMRQKDSGPSRIGATWRCCSALCSFTWPQSEGVRGAWRASGDVMGSQGSHPVFAVIMALFQSRASRYVT